MKTKQCSRGKPWQKEREALLAKQFVRDGELGCELATKRKAKGLKSGWVATQMGISPAYLSDLEHGNRHWNDALLAQYEKAIS